MGGSGNVHVPTRVITVSPTINHGRGQMKAKPNTFSGRFASSEAAHFLHSHGFETLRVSGSALFDLVAWKDGRVIFLAAKRVRGGEGLDKWANQVFALVDAVRGGGIPGEIQFWVCRSGVWKRYEILAGGAAPAEWSP